MNMIQTISAAEAKKRIADGTASLCDIREPQEYARENIAGARSMPLSILNKDKFPVPAAAQKTAIIFHCQSGNRTKANADKLCALNLDEAYILDGGLNGWKAAGFKTHVDHSKPIELQRQVQIAAGSLILLGLLLAWLVTPWGLALSTFVGGGLVFAGISGWCGMARVLAIMPWNRAAAAL